MPYPAEPEAFPQIPTHAIHPTTNTFYSSIILFRPMYEIEELHRSVVAEMGISAYQIEKVWMAYNKQSRLKFRLEMNSAPVA